MNSTLRFRIAAAVVTTVGVAALLTTLGSAAAPKFLPDDPLWVEHDTEDASGMTPLEASLLVDVTYNILTSRGSSHSRAKNVNTVDEVPDSSWFTNRIGHRPLTPDEVAVGPDSTEGPAPGDWTVTSSKSDGVTPGFTVKDAHGQRWFLKFDPPGYRGMSTGTEVTVTKLMWALGYNVPENHIAYMQRRRLVVGERAQFTPPGGNTRVMRPNDIDTLLERADRGDDGSYRVVASKALEGTPIGRIRFRDARPDDPNDLVAHEHRRELRGYAVFAAWLNHFDANSINSLDMLITSQGRAFVRHNLIDFGSALGSGGVEPADYWEGAQYLVQPGSIGKQMIGFGLSFPKWHTTKFYESPSIGRLPEHNADFNPERWKPRVPNQAFLEARADDKFWAAQKLVALTTDMLRAAVRSADFRDPASEAFLVRALAERRDAVGRMYLTAINPIADPSFDTNGVVAFRNAAVDADFAQAPSGYRATWSAFDNATGSCTLLGETTSTGTEITAPGRLQNMPGLSAPGAIVRVALSAIDGLHASWAKPVHAYFQRVDTTWRLVGFERLPEAR